MQNKKGSRIFYDIFETVNQLNGNGNGWLKSETLAIMIYDYVMLRLVSLRRLNLQDFQFKINHKILITNYFLWKIGKIDNLCSHCKEHPERNNHLFLTCAKVQEFGNSLKTWLYENGYITVSIEKCNIIFSLYSNIKVEIV